MSTWWPRWGRVAAIALVAVLAACSSGSGTTGSGPRPQRTATTTSPTAAATNTTTPASSPDLAAVAVKLTRVANVTRGTALAVRPGDRALYVAQQEGRIVAIRDGHVDPVPVLDLAGRLASGGERGLLGLTFSRDGKTLYVHYTDTNGDTTLEAYEFSRGRARATSARLLLKVAQPQPNHNGGQLSFGPDGVLYLGLGDGGSGNDTGPGHAPEGNGQSLDTLLGKILRIDPTPTQTKPYRIPAGNPFIGRGRPEIWAYGLRNPWRFSFDRETGDLWIGDVGQGAREEVDFMPFAAAAGANYGWPGLEGTLPLRGAPPGAVPPVFETRHDDGYCAIAGGYVYRGKRIPKLRGSYVFGDFCKPPITALRLEGGKAVAERDLGIQAAAVSSFGEDADGELYVVSQRDGVFRIDPA